MAIEDAILKALRQKKEYEMVLMFRKNIVFFKEYIPDLFDKFNSFSPKNVFFSYDKCGNINLKNTLCGGGFVYSRSPIDLSRDSVDAFVEKPIFRVVRAKSSEIIDNVDDIHHDTTNKAIELLESSEFVRGIDNRYYDLLILNGLGLGYVLNDLLSKVDINHLIIIEPSEDIFYAAMHIVDWQAVFKYFMPEHKSLNIVIGEENDSEVSQALDQHIRNIGIHHAVLPYIFDHLGSESINKIIDRFFKRMNFTLSAAGFSDDEIWSVAHTVENWASRYPVLQRHAFYDDFSIDKPVFVIANGPSLDKAIEFIKVNRKKAVLISCGTTIASLMKVGIKPDIHLEMERRYITYEWLSQTTTDEYRKGIRFIGLNTVHPDVFRLFEHSYMAMKPIDSGSRYCNRFVDPRSGAKCVLLLNSNPTVGNMGVAIASALGFSSVYLLGLDLAMSADKAHHSRLSTYYDLNDDNDDNDEFIRLELADEEASTIEVEGNFCEKVRTTRLFIGSIICAERSILDSTHQKYFNTSDGALIKGAIPTSIHGINLGEVFDTEGVTEEALSNCFGRDGLLNIDDFSMVSKDLSFLVPSLLLFRRIFEEPFLDWRDVVYRLDSQMLKVSDMDKLGPNMSCIHYMLKGSIFYWNLLFMQGVYRGRDEAVSLDLVNSVREIYLDYIDRTIVKCRDGLLNIDDKNTRLKHRLSNGNPL